MPVQTLNGAAAEAVATEPGWGHQSRRRRLSEAEIAEAQRIMGGAFAGNWRATVELKEALSSDDFRAIAFEILDREMMERYADLPQTWSAYCRRTTVRDFKPKRMVDLLGGRAALDVVPELTEYPERKVSKALYTMSVTKYGGRFQISWESIVNDELGEIQNLPGDLAIAARDTESRAAAGLLTDGTGENGSYFSATAYNRVYTVDNTTVAGGSFSGGSSNLASGNPALTVDALSNAITAINQRKDLEGRPIAFPGLVLVVPPALEVAASNIVNALQIRVAGTGISSGNGETVIMNNWLAGKVKVVVEPWLPVLDTGANVNTQWYLLPDPAVSRPAFYLGFLAGHESPDLRVKADAGNSLGGGQLGPEDGSFDIDDIQYRVRHVLGGTGTDMIATYTSNGSGS